MPGSPTVSAQQSAVNRKGREKKQLPASSCWLSAKNRNQNRLTTEATEDHKGYGQSKARQDFAQGMLFG